MIFVSNGLIKYNTESLQRELPELGNSRVEIFFDTEDEFQFQQVADVFRTAGQRKVKRLIAVILKNEYHDQLYKKGKEDSAIIKLTVETAEEQFNYQIVCREIFESDRKIVLVQSCSLKE